MKKFFSKNMIIAVCALGLTLLILSLQLYAWFAVSDGINTGYEIGVPDEAGEAGLDIILGSGGGSGEATLTVLPGEKLIIKVEVRNNTNRQHVYRIKSDGIVINYPAENFYTDKIIKLPDYVNTDTLTRYSEDLIGIIEFKQFITPVTDALEYALYPHSGAEFSYHGFLTAHGVSGAAVNTNSHTVAPADEYLHFYNNADGLFTVEAESKLDLALELYFRPDKFITVQLGETQVRLNNSNPYMGQKFQLNLTLETIG